MRLIYKLNNLLLISLLIFLFGLSAEIKGQEKGDKKPPLISVNVNILDEQDLPIANAMITTAGVVTGFTGAKGVFPLEAVSSDKVLISKNGYADLYVTVEELLKNPVVYLESESLFLSSADIIPMPFMNIKKRHSTSSAYLINSEDMEKYPTIDVRNSLTGLAPGLQVKEINGAPGMQAEELSKTFDRTDKIRFYTRGRSPIYIIDDVPAQITEIQIEQMEIESVTIIKDIVGKAMYGPAAADGIIYIKTKRGKTDQKLLKVNAESGLHVTDRFPQWVLGADHARLNNLARTNSGIAPVYSESDISEYAKNDPYNMYHPGINYRDMMLKNSMNMRKANVSYEGGDRGIRFFSNIGYSGEDDLYKIGPISDYNRLNVRSNLDIGINELLSVKLNIFGGLTIRRSPNYGYSSGYGSDGSSDAELDIIEFNSVISDITSISPIAFPVYANYDEDEQVYWYGVDPAFPYNPIGRLTSNGYYSEYGRTGATNIAFDYDMKNILPGLKSTTFASFDIFNLLRIGKAEQYIAYNVIPSKTSGGADTILLTKAHDGVDMAGQAKLHDFYYQRYTGYQSFQYDRAIGNNSFLQSALIYKLSRVTRDQVKEPERQQDLILTGLFTNSDKYSIQGVLDYAGSSSLPQGKRYGLFPSVGVSWVISEENFMSGISLLDYLKLRIETGILGFENFDPPFYYQDSWTYNTSGGNTGAAPTGYWFGSDLVSTMRSNINRIGNPNLKWEKRKEISAGFDALLFNKKLELEVTYYNNVRDGILTNLSYVVPYTTGIAFTNNYFNYNSTRYYGVESSIRYSSQAGDFRYSVGAMTTIQNSKILKYDEPDFRFDYQSRIGQPADAYRGLTYLGRFVNNAEALIIPQLFDESLQAGDLKYKDLNGDGVVDNNDVSMIGHTSPRLIYALNLQLSYKNFDFTMIADGIAFVDLPLTNSYFRNGWGDGAYSEFVRDNIGGDYPRLSYYQISNNFQASEFWLTKGGYFKIQNVELAYTLPQSSSRALSARKVKFFVRGANLLTLTEVKYIDPESPASGVSMYPLFKTFTGGLNFIF